jgi:DMSO/TMAO reductase YedYZ molybdopterin-dependent catalytic subunit
MWTGVPLSHVLDQAGVLPDAAEVVFRGADRGTVEARPGQIYFERSLALDIARTSQSTANWKALTVKAIEVPCVGDQPGLSPVLALYCQQAAFRNV